MQARRRDRHPRAEVQQEAGRSQPGIPRSGERAPHLELDKSKLSAKVVGRSEREWVALEINELLVVEYYSRKV